MDEDDYVGGAMLTTAARPDAFRDLADEGVHLGWRFEMGKLDGKVWVGFESPIGEIEVVRGTDEQSVIAEARKKFRTIVGRVERITGTKPTKQFPHRAARAGRARGREHRARRHRAASRSAGGGDPEPPPHALAARLRLGGAA